MGAGVAQAQPPQDQGLIGNYHNHVQINPSLQPIAERLGLKRMVPVAVDRAVADIITPVVERSVTIACMTTQELILKVCEHSFTCHCPRLPLQHLPPTLSAAEGETQNTQLLCRTLQWRRTKAACARLLI